MQADAPINTNLSVSMCELLSSTVLTIYEDVTAGRSRGDVVVSRRFAPYVLRNETGIVLRYGAAEQGEPTTLLVPGESQELNLWAHATDRIALCSEEGAPRRALAVVCDGWSLSLIHI